MTEAKERVLNGFMNVLFIGLPIALVVMFGEKFSLWLNLLALGCLLFTSCVLSMIGDEYESPKRMLLALIGASIAVCLHVLAYPGHATMIILGTVLIISTYDLIDRGQIIWLEFARRSRLRFLGKFILLTTFLFVISLIIANFGNQKIWIPIVAASLIIALLISKDNYLYDDELGGKLIFVPAVLIFAGIISTIVQFWTAELFWGIKLWQLLLAIVLIAIIIAAKMIISANLHAKVLAQERREEEARKNEIREREKKEKVDLFNAVAAKDPTMMTIRDLSALYSFNKTAAIYPFLGSNVTHEHIASLLTISVRKKQMVWQAELFTMLNILELIAEKSYSDEELSRVTGITNAIKQKIANAKADETVELTYKGEKELILMLDKIETAANAKN